MSIDHPPAKLIAAVVGLSSFIAAIGAGWLAGNPGVIVLLRALVCMAVGDALGRVLGWVTEVTAGEYLESYKASNPIADELKMPDDAPESELA
ncbi:MAG: hypothetical protein AAF297_07980 [Planctomycetota bacterium]